MKKFFVCLLTIVSFHVAMGQDSNTVVINRAKQNEQELAKKRYQYPEFLTGKAIYKNETVTQAKLNYSYLTNNIAFINPKGDTLELSGGEDFKIITIGVDTFCYNKKEFVQQLTHNSNYNLFIKRSLQFNGSEKKGAYDTYSGTSSTSSYNTFTPVGEGHNVTLTPDENLLYRITDYYFFSGKFGQLYPATKKGMYDLFSKNQRQLKDFLEENKINFNKKEDLEKVLNFARTVLK